MKELLSKHSPKIVEGIFCVLIALLPVLAPYGSSTSISMLLIGFMALIMVVLLPIFFKKEIIASVLLLIIVFILSARGFMLSKAFLIVISFLCFIFFLLYPKKAVLLPKLIKYLSFIFALIVILQTVVHFLFGYHIPFIMSRLCLPELEGSYHDLIETGTDGRLYRPSACFLEPAMLSQYCFVGLVLCLFSRKKIDIIFGLIISIGVVCTTSGIGIVLVGASWLFFIVYLFIKGKFKTRLIIGIFAVVVAGVVILLYFKSPNIKGAIDRIFNGSAIHGRIFWFATYFKNMGVVSILFGNGSSSLPSNIYFTGMMEFVYSVGIIGTLAIVTIFVLTSSRINVCGIVIGGAFIALQLFANNVNTPFLFFLLATICNEKEPKLFIRVNNYFDYYKKNISKVENAAICKNSTCTGCGLCSQICPNKAITLVEDELGFLRPRINLDKCDKCNKCRTNCPANQKLSDRYPLKCYAATSKPEKKFANSTSGGIASLIAKNIVSSGGVFYGAVFDSLSKRFIYKRIDNLDDIKLLSGSKYVQADLNNTYSECSSDLDNGKTVAFIGNPCYVDGLKKYLGKDSDNLLLIDLVCHGVPSQKMFWDSLGFRQSRIRRKELSNITFRDGRNYLTRIYDSNGKVVYKGDFYSDCFIESFCKSMSLRHSCYHCKYASSSRVGDITLGDFWGISDESRLFELRNNGLSLCLINSDKGLKYFSRISEDIITDERTVKEAVDGNSQLRRASTISTDTIDFEYNYPNVGFTESVKGCRNTKQKVRRMFLAKLLVKNNKSN